VKPSYWFVGFRVYCIFELSSSRLHCSSLSIVYKILCEDLHNDSDPFTMFRQLQIHIFPNILRKIRCRVYDNKPTPTRTTVPNKTWIDPNTQQTEQQTQALTCIIANSFKISSRRSNRARNGRPRQSANRRNTQEHPGSSAHVPGFAHLHDGIGKKGDVYPGAKSIEL